MLSSAEAPAGLCPRSGTWASHLWSSAGATAHLLLWAPARGVFPRLCGLHASSETCSLPLGLAFQVGTWQAMCKQGSGHKSSHWAHHVDRACCEGRWCSCRMPTQMALPTSTSSGLGRLLGLQPHWARTGHGEKASESLTRHRMYACALGRAGAAGSLGRPSTDLIWPWTRFQRIGHWPVAVAVNLPL